MLVYYIYYVKCGLGRRCYFESIQDRDTSVKDMNKDTRYRVIEIGEVVL